jgi:hypothetical protein
VAGDVPFSVAVGDFNNDDRLDVVTANQHGNRASVLVRSRLFNGFQGVQQFPIGAGPTAVALADFNGDGRLDIAAANFNFNNVGVLLNIMQPTQTTLVTSQNPAPAGAAVQFTAVVQQDPAFPPINFKPVGLVQFFDGTKLIAGVHLRSDATAVLVRSNLAVGAHPLSALYIGDNRFSSSIALGTVTQVITPAIASQAFIHTIIGGLSAPATITAGTRGAAQVIIQNQGGVGTSGVLNVRLLLSTDDSISTDDVPLITSVGDLTLNMTPHRSISFADNFTLPAGVAPGAYFVLAELVLVSGFAPTDLSPAPAVSATMLRVT